MVPEDQVEPAEIEQLFQQNDALLHQSLMTSIDQHCPHLKLHFESLYPNEDPEIHWDAKEALKSL